MGSRARGAAAVLLSLLALLGGLPPLGAQELSERDALCNADGCYVVYFQRKSFLDSWRACKEKGGTLATIKRQEEADSVAALFSGVELRGGRASVRMWIGLQRQPRQCTASQPLRGFSWTTGDQDTQYTNWQREDQPATCSVPRCVALAYSTAAHQQGDNFKWLDGACSLPADGYVCRYAYRGMCPAVWNEGGGNALYATPFHLLSSSLTHVPYGSVATVPCPGGTRGEQSALCTQREDGAVGWSREAPLCSDAPRTAPGAWCGRDNGGCQHFCREAGDHFFCECSEGYQLAEDGLRCDSADECLDAPCEFECLPLPDGFRCACPEGYMLAADGHGCQDVDECLQSPCQQLCVNAPGTFECRCRRGYRPDGHGDGECEDVDECAADPCEHACENTPGAHICHCHLGFYPQPEDPGRCLDVDECQIPDTCDQMCINYEGGFECHCEVGYELMDDHFSCRKIGENPAPTTAAYPWQAGRLPASPLWDPSEPYGWTTPPSHSDWPQEGDDTLDWLTDPPKGGENVIWVTRDPLDRRPLKPYDSTPKELDWTELRGAVVPEWSTTPSMAPTPSPTGPPDWYETEEEEDGDEEETTTALHTIPTTTISEGAWNWFWISPTPPSQEPGDLTQDERDGPATEGPDDVEVEGDGDDEQVIVTDSPEFTVRVVEVGEVEKIYLAEEATGLPLDQLLHLPTSTPPEPEGVEVKDPEAGDQKQGGSTWLLVGLLVPLCIFVVVMVALGIIYCTRCAVQPRHKSATDCYHWISGAHDKQCAGSLPEGVKSQV